MTCNFPLLPAGGCGLRASMNQKSQMPEVKNFKTLVRIPLLQTSYSHLVYGVLFYPFFTESEKCLEPWSVGVNDSKLATAKTAVNSSLGQYCVCEVTNYRIFQLSELDVPLHPHFACVFPQSLLPSAFLSGLSLFTIFASIVAPLYSTLSTLPLPLSRPGACLWRRKGRGVRRGA